MLRGPAGNVAAAPFVVVAGRDEDPAEARHNLHLAVYIANQFALTSDTFVQVVMDDGDGAVVRGMCAHIQRGKRQM